MHKKLAVTVIIDFRTVESCTFNRNLGFNPHVAFNTKEQTILESIKDAFEGKNVKT